MESEPFHPCYLPLSINSHCYTVSCTESEREKENKAVSWALLFLLLSHLYSSLSLFARKISDPTIAEKITIICYSLPLSHSSELNKYIKYLCMQTALSSLLLIYIINLLKCANCNVSFYTRNNVSSILLILLQHSFCF